MLSEAEIYEDIGLLEVGLGARDVLMEERDRRAWLLRQFERVVCPHLKAAPPPPPIVRTAPHPCTPLPLPPCRAAGKHPPRTGEAHAHLRGLGHGRGAGLCNRPQVVRRDGVSERAPH